ncbi:hypothetical protein H920_17733 [Fukomys damarensis]|uniref:Uncharacterized protein n=1 Tax=Fukomys damarensis TaxID=885580 RepID=A0A091CTP7_FUKDA|nr:hypothetical protein H920_17733 [Fukomys damarensis]
MTLVKRTAKEQAMEEHMMSVLGREGFVRFSRAGSVGIQPGRWVRNRQALLYEMNPDILTPSVLFSAALKMSPVLVALELHIQYGMTPNFNVTCYSIRDIQEST